ncbi:AAA family ATPase [Paenibacillus xerothermodurans]|uniref:ATP-binding protein n=1 Tax=Paenibacillus xerothermodurans TaxID=1977292 RepID=A0A2W1NQC8_PAEXE|nr:ATP-binding protein [Paenibacillus xerothermodurans]PZE21113.1 ATP-binding protein [Paenibacillus xerothermodurans]
MSNESQKQIIYLISGPLGVGKSTTSKELAQRVRQCVLIEGDNILHMFQGESQPAWDERLRLTWENIRALTRNFMQHGLNVVIDFVVEDELDWFCEQISDLNVALKYVVLHADKATIAQRLTRRGDIQMLERSLFLLHKMERDPSNRPFLYDSTTKQTGEIVADIINGSRFTVVQKEGSPP